MAAITATESAPASTDGRRRFRSNSPNRDQRLVGQRPRPPYAFQSDYWVGVRLAPRREYRPDGDVVDRLQVCRAQLTSRCASRARPILSSPTRLRASVAGTSSWPMCTPSQPTLCDQCARSFRISFIPEPAALADHPRILGHGFVGLLLVAILQDLYPRLGQLRHDTSQQGLAPRCDLQPPRAAPAPHPGSDTAAESAPCRGSSNGIPQGEKKALPRRSVTGPVPH